MKTPAEAIVDLYERHANAWAADRNDGLDLERRWLDRFAALIRPAGALLDLGCGSGEPIGAYLARRGFVVTGVDSSPSLIAICRERLATQEWRVGDMRSLDLGRRYDGLIAWHSFFHLTGDDQRRTFGVFEAHAAPEAVLMFTSGPSHREAIGCWQGEPLYHASLAPDEYRDLLDAHGFELLENVLNDPECGGATVWLARKRAGPSVDIPA